MVRTRRFLTFLVLAGCVVLLSEAALAVNKPVRRQPVKQKVPQKAAPAQSKPVVPPPIFAQGETLRFSATFNQLDAGGGEVQLWKEKQTDGREVFRFTGKARTSEWVDLLYKRRDNADATFGLNDYAPLSFVLFSRESDRRREYSVRYDPATKALVGSVKRKNRVRELSLPAGKVYDPISALYLLRSRVLVPGTPIETQIFTGRSHYRFVAQVLEKETIEVDGQKRPALRLRPEVYSLEKDTNENILPQETTLWVSADPLHIPLKLESGTMWGWIVVELGKRSLKAEG
jgi:hypothetical protein